MAYDIIFTDGSHNIIWLDHKCIYSMTVIDYFRFTFVIAVFFRSDVADTSADTGRASLLASIRGFEKSKLQKAGGRKIARKKKKHDDAATDGGGGAPGKSGGGGLDLMSDLAAKLQLRRKGISGAGKTAASSSAGATSDGGDSDAGNRGRISRNPLDRISKLLPPPPPVAAADANDTHDDDWA